MFGLTAKILIISWTIAAKSASGFEEPEDARSVSKITDEFSRLTQQPSLPPIPTEEDIESNALYQQLVNHLAAPTVLEELKADIMLLLKKMKACRKSFGKNNQTFNTELYRSLLSGLMGDENKEYKAALRHCNITEELVDKLKAELPQLDLFQGFFVMVPKHNSSGSADLRKSSQKPSPPASGPPSHGTIQATALENNLKLKIGDEWIPIKPRVSHLRHIYLGSSVYPILTEESRVLDKEQTIAGPTPTKQSFAPDHDTASEPEPLPSRKIPPRVARSVRRKLLKYTKSETKIHDYSDSPQRVYLLPKSSYVWKDNNVETRCPVQLKRYREDPRYQMLYKLCSVILENVKKVFQPERLKKKNKVD